ncbi:MAG: ATP-dependent RNA helicase HrpA [Akkermansia muciniphila]
MNITYPDLPISRRRNDILAAMREHQVIVVVGETGSGKTTQLPKMAMELAGEARGRVGCTQPRRLAAASVSRRVAEELNCDLGGLVGYQVRFEEKAGPDTRLKFMTDGILLAETQHDPDLRQYHTLILDEAHERSLNIDFLLGYLRLLLGRRRDLRLVISSATLDAGGFSEFFGGAPIIQVEGRTYPVDLHYLPPLHDDEELPAHVARAVDWLDTLDDRGDVLVFLPGEREIREVAEKLKGRNLRNTCILPLFARLGLADQQRIFHPEQGYRRIVLATNVAETSLTIPGIIYVIDSGLARVSRYSPARQVQRLQIEPVSKASARQRAGRCGRVCEGVCIRLYSEKDWEDRPEFTDPEIRRSALAGALLRMKDLGLPEMPEFPLPDPPSSKLVTEGYRTLREIGALDKARQLTPVGRKLARLPIDPRLARMLLEAQHEQALPEMLVIVAGLGIMDPRERPADAAQKADQAHAQWKEEDSDFLSLLKLWKAAWQFREGRRWRKNQLRKWCGKNFLNFNRMMEWFNLWEDLSRLVRETLKCRISPLEEKTERQASFAMIHRSILAGVPRQFGLWDADNREYRGAGGRSFGIFPGSGLFRRKKRSEWVMGVELVDTTRLWMRRASILEPEWVERVAPHLCESHYSGARWDREQGAVYAVERVVCGGLRIIDNRRVHYGRINPAHAREIMIREGLLGGGFRTKPACIRHLETLREDVRQIELKLRRPDQVWCEEGVFEFFNRLVPPGLLYGQGLFAVGRRCGEEKSGSSACSATGSHVRILGGKTCWMVFRMKSPVKERNMPCITRMIPARKMTA